VVEELKIASKKERKFSKFTVSSFDVKGVVRVKVKQSRYKPGVFQRVPGS